MLSRLFIKKRNSIGEKGDLCGIFVVTAIKGLW
jgi:hypothetical protein